PVERAKPPARLRGRASTGPRLPAAASKPSIRALHQPSIENAEDGRERRTADEFWWKIPLENALMHDRMVPANPFFSAACRAASGANHGTVHAPQLIANRTHFDLRGAHAIQCFVQRAIGVPLIEQSPDGLPLSEFLGKIPPWRTASQDPENSIENSSSINRRTTGDGTILKQVGN